MTIGDDLDPGRRRARLTFVRAVHTVIYVVMASACFVVLHAGLFGWSGPLLWGALLLVGVEVAVFAGNGMKCPLTAVAVRYGATPEGAYDTFFPERFTRHTARIFTPIIAIGTILVGARQLGLF